MSGRKKIVSTAKGSLTMIAMAILIVTSILSLRGLPSEAKFGVQSIFYYIFAAIVFLVPFSLVCAELASTYTPVSYTHLDVYKRQIQHPTLKKVSSQ